MLLHDARNQSDPLRPLIEAREYAAKNPACDYPGCKSAATWLHRKEERYTRRCERHKDATPPESRPEAPRSTPRPAVPHRGVEYRGLSPACRGLLRTVPDHTGNGHC